jgi:hypothetical protein
MKIRTTTTSTHMRLVLLISLVGLVFAALSCGNNSGVGVMDATSNGGDKSLAGTPVRGTAVMNTITEDEIATLPKWQQELLADPGWNQPYIEPRADTAMPAPSYELLMSETAKVRNAPTTFAPRLGGETGGKGVSWNKPGSWVPPTETGKGEYAQLHAGDAPWGCKDPVLTSHGHSVDEHIAAHPYPDSASQVISYTERGNATPNHFSGSGGVGNDNLSAVYQLYSSDRDADPLKTLDEWIGEGGAIPSFAEISYRADGGAGSPGACDPSVQAYEVNGYFWWRFNTVTKNLPGGNSTPLYNLLIAPSSEKSAPGTSGGDTVGRLQNFYLGNVTNCYGGGAIVGLDSADSSCGDFEDLVNDPVNEFFFTNPIYGVLLKRWQDSVLASMPSGTDPWEAEFGWPVFGPIAYNDGGAILTGNGAYHAWGMFFEDGFTWWIDYVNNNNVPDEAQAYSFSGSNVYCADDKVYEKLPTVFYGGSGALGVSVVVEASLNPDRGPGTPAPGTFYEVALPDATGLATISLDMHAHGYGGTPRASDCAYKHYTWAFRDGSIGQTNSTPYDNSSQYVTHTYGSIDRNQESIYIVRVQVVDSTGAIAYGDTLPVHVGHGAGGSGPGGEIVIIRADGGDYQTNLDALTADLDTLGAAYGVQDYTDTVADDLAGGDQKVVIWYRGGPGANGEPPMQTAWTNEEIDNYIQLQKDGGKVWLMSQSHGFQDASQWWVNGWSGIYAYSLLTPTVGMGDAAKRRHPWAASFATDDGIGFGGSLGFINTAPTEFIGSPDGKFGSDGTQAAERYTGANSSTKTPVTLGLGNLRQFCGVGYYSPFFANFTAGPNFHAGMNVNPTALGYDLGFVSWGNSAAPDENIGSYPSYQHVAGPGKLWITGHGWEETTITASNTGDMTRADLARNILASLDGSLTFSSGGGSGDAKTNNGFEEYIGLPEIVSVTPAYWDAADHMYRAGGQTLAYSADTANGGYPDQMMQDIYRSTNNTGLSNEIITIDPNNDWKNGNDVDFGYPWYGYLNDGANNTVELGGVAPNFGWIDDSISYGGLLLADPDASWARYTPAGIPSVQAREEFNNTSGRAPRPLVAGYYKTTNVGAFADDIMANYGSSAHAFDGLPVGQEWKNADKLTVEAIAHWPATLKYFNFGAFTPQDAQIFWSMHPGHNMAVPGTGLIIGVTADFDAYRTSFDIDPSTAPSGRNGLSIWNRPSFNFGNPASAGRVVEFPYNKLKAWNPDHNRDGVRNNSDKFPIRCRLFTNHQAYFTKEQAAASKWPNHLTDAGLNPATTPPDSRLESFQEGGCYVVDFGDPINAVIIGDDPAMPDPGFGGTLSGSTGNYQIDFYYTLKYGIGQPTGFKVELDTHYTGVFDPLSPNYGAVPAPQIYTTPGNKAWMDAQIPAAQPNGNYVMALRVTDQDDGNYTAVFAWGAAVPLFPSSVFTENFSPSGLNMSTVWLSSSSGGFQTWQPGGTNPFIATSTAYTADPYFNFTVNPFEGAGAGNAFLRATTQFANTNLTTNNYMWLQSRDFPVANGTLYNVRFYTNGGGENSFARLYFMCSFNGGVTWTFPGQTSGTFMTGSSAFTSRSSVAAPFNSKATRGWGCSAAGPGWIGQSLGNWRQANGTIVSTGTTMRIAFIYDDDIWIRPPGPAIDNISVF